MNGNRAVIQMLFCKTWICIEFHCVHLWLYVIKIIWMMRSLAILCIYWTWNTLIVISIQHLIGHLWIRVTKKTKFIRWESKISKIWMSSIILDSHAIKSRRKHMMAIGSWWLLHWNSKSFIISTALTSWNYHSRAWKLSEQLRGPLVPTIVLHVRTGVRKCWICHSKGKGLIVVE